MQTHLHTDLLQLKQVEAAGDILRSCVHCGFCLSVCPTYLVTGDEADSPRGRIYLIKTMLEENQYPESTQTHLDRCLTCRACESVCPSGVDYATLLDTGRQVLFIKSRRRLTDFVRRRLLVGFLQNRLLFKLLLITGRFLRPVLPARLSKLVPPVKKVAGEVLDSQNLPPLAVSGAARKMLLLEGCVQSDLSPEVNNRLTQLLAIRNIELVPVTPGRCCGAMDYHSGFPQRGLDKVREFIDECSALVESGVEQLVVSASGCGAFIKDYARLLVNDPEYSEKAQRLTSLVCDASEVIAREFDQEPLLKSNVRLAWHSPCTLRYSLGVENVVEGLLESAGFELVSVSDEVLCCGSAGTYSLLEQEMASKLQQRKIEALLVGNPDMIVTANVGCQFHLQGATDIPVRHWIEVYAEKMIKQS